MATKTGITSAISAALSILITKAKLITSLGKINDELYGANTFNDTQATSNVLTLALSGGLYNLNFTKNGNVVYVFGKLQKNSGNIPDSTVIANITNSEFYPMEGKQFRLFGFFEGNETNVPFVFENDGINRKIRNFKLVPATQEYYINGTYLTDPQ